MSNCQLIIDPPQRGSWNMAVDEWLLRRAATEGVLTLRFYQWDEPTLSLGYFQSHADRQSHAASRGLPMIRRASGGGALVHDCELTYSLAIPANSPLTRESQTLYEHAHLALVDTLNDKLLRPSVAAEAANFSLYPQKLAGTTEKQFLCFCRRAKGDVIFSESSQVSDEQRIVLGHKVCGSAQRKWHGAILQHGGLLLSQSPFAPELPGLTELLPKAPASPGSSPVNAIEPLALSEWWIEPLSERLGLELQVSEPFSRDQRSAVEQIESTKYAASSWIMRR